MSEEQVATIGHSIDASPALTHKNAGIQTYFR
jgi:hypothetical protein